jgi:hypothetical protein
MEPTSFGRYLSTQGTVAPRRAGASPTTTLELAAALELAPPKDIGWSINRFCVFGGHPLGACAIIMMSSVPLAFIFFGMNEI